MPVALCRRNGVFSMRLCEHEAFCLNIKFYSAAYFYKETINYFNLFPCKYKDNNEVIQCLGC